MGNVSAGLLCIALTNPTVPVKPRTTQSGQATDSTDNTVGDVALCSRHRVLSVIRGPLDRVVRGPIEPRLQSMSVAVSAERDHGDRQRSTRATDNTVQSRHGQHNPIKPRIARITRLSTLRLAHAPCSSCHPRPLGPCCPWPDRPSQRPWPSVPSATTEIANGLLERRTTQSSHATDSTIQSSHG